MSFQFFKSLFKKAPGFALGALPSPEDKRNINIAAIQAPVMFPYDEFETTLPYVRNQGAKPKCVGCAISTLAELYISRKEGQSVPLSDDDLYEQCKAIDGIPNLPGTYPSVGASIAFKTGIATQMAYDTKDANIIAQSRKKAFGGYAFVSGDFDSVAQAIYQNGAVAMSVAVDSNFFMGIITKILQSVGQHYIIGKGAKISTRTIKGRNSWGIEWIGHIAGMINPAVKPGEFEACWDDIAGTTHDIIVFADIPPEILKVVTEKPYYFRRTLKRGDTGPDVLELQKRYMKEGVWRVGVPMLPIFGPATTEATIRYQIKNNIIASTYSSGAGMCGPLTIRSLNKEIKLSLVDAIIQVESEGNDWAIGDKNLKDKAYGPMQIRQPACDDVNAHTGGKFRAEDMLGNRDRSIAIFNKYTEIYKATTDEQKARLWNGGPGGVIYPSRTDRYWSKVRALMQ